MVEKVKLVVVFLLLNAANIFAVGQSAVITLVFPSGARSLGMGEIGTALADDEDVLFYNPAGLGLRNSRWYGGASTMFCEQLLPMFKIPDLWHFHGALCFQFPFTTTVGFGKDFNRINFGSDDFTGKNTSYEYVVTNSVGFNLDGLGIKNHAFGISPKYFYSAFAPGTGPGNQGTAQSVALDLGYLWQFLPFMRFGLTLANMGPSVYYISQDQEDPIPFTINAALAYKDDFCTRGNERLRFLEICAESRFDREVVKNYPDKSPDPFWKAIYTGLLHDTSMTFQEQLDEFVLHTGVELKILSTLSLRHGWLIDRAGQRFENHLGFGVSLFNHFQMDFSYILAPRGYVGWLFGHGGASGARDEQWGMNLTFFRMFCWNENDRRWWIK